MIKWSDVYESILHIVKELSIIFALLEFKVQCELYIYILELLDLKKFGFPDIFSFFTFFQTHTITTTYYFTLIVYYEISGCLSFSLVHKPFMG